MDLACELVEAERSMVCYVAPETQSSLWCNSVHKTAVEAKSQWCGFWPGGHWQSASAGREQRGTLPPHFPLYSIRVSRAVARVTPGRQQSCVGAGLRV